MSETTTAPKLRQGIAEEVRVLLARRRMSATKLAQDLGWSQPYMARRMAGVQAFDSDDLEAIAEAFGVKPGDLLPPIARYASLADLHLEHPPVLHKLPIPDQARPTERALRLAQQRATGNIPAQRGV